MTDVPMLADVAVRLAFGLAALLSMTSWRSVPLPFFRTHCQVILGLLVLASLDVSRTGGAIWTLVIPITAAILAYAATVAWGLGLPRVGRPATILIVLASAAWLVFESRSGRPGLSTLNAASRLASGFLLGATLTAMLLGHHYLTAPTMSIDPLKRYVRLIALGLAGRGLVALCGLFLARSGTGLLAVPAGAGGSLFLLMRWGMGFVAAALATYLAWRTVQIRSTQSATGILYVATTLVLFGELSSLVGGQSTGLLG